jgi:hypothetical protein
VLATTEGKEFALKKLTERRTQAKKDGQIDDGKLPAGAPMHYYCKTCGLIAEVLPENWFWSPPKKFCSECQALKDAGWLE